MVILHFIGADKGALYLTLIAFGTPLGLNTVVFPAAYGGDTSTGASMAMISHTLWRNNDSAYVCAFNGVCKLTAFVKKRYVDRTKKQTFYIWTLIMRFGGLYRVFAQFFRKNLNDEVKKIIIILS